MELKQTLSIGTLLCMAFLAFNLLVYYKNMRQVSLPRIFVVNQSSSNIDNDDTQRFTIRNKIVQRQFRNRVNRVQQVCKDHKDLLTESENKDPLLKVYSLEPSEKIAICRTAKHGSTTWAKNFMHVYLNKKEFVKGPKVYQRELAKLENQNYTLDEKEAVINSFRNKNHMYLTFFVCRNPIERQVKGEYFNISTFQRDMYKKCKIIVPRLISVYNYMKVLR